MNILCECMIHKSQVCTVTVYCSWWTPKTCCGFGVRIGAYSISISRSRVQGLGAVVRATGNCNSSFFRKEIIFSNPQLMNKKARYFSLTSVFCGSRDIISDQWEGRRISRDHQLERLARCARGNPSRQLATVNSERLNSRLVVWAEQLRSLLTVITAFCLTATETNLFDLTSLKRRQCLVCVSVNADNIIEYG